MLPRINRLKRRKDFETVYKLGAGKRGEPLALRFLENNLNYSRIGFIVSKKIADKATVRNLIKRRLRQATRLLLPEFRPGFDIVIFSLQGIEDLDFSQIKGSLKHILKKANLLQKDVYN